MYMNILLELKEELCMNINKINFHYYKHKFVLIYSHVLYLYIIVITTGYSHVSVCYRVIIRGSYYLVIKQRELHGIQVSILFKYTYS